MATKETEKKEIDLETEYERLSGMEEIYYRKINSWRKVRRIALVVVPVSFVLTISNMILFLRTDRPLLEDLVIIPLPTYAFLASFAIFVLMILADALAMSKIRKIRRDFGLSRDERLYIRSFEARNQVELALAENKKERKVHLRELALKKAEVVADIIDNWNYGNIGLISNLIGDKIDLLKDNVRRLLLSNVAIGDEEALRRISDIFTRFCKFVLFPSVEGLVDLNATVGKLPYKKYQHKTRIDNVVSYFYDRPRTSRLLFALIVSIVVAVTSLYIGLNISAIATVTGASFWGAFMGFDKLFRTKK